MARAGTPGREKRPDGLAAGRNSALRQDSSDAPAGSPGPSPFRAAAACRFSPASDSPGPPGAKRAASSAVTSHQIYDSCSKPAPGVCIQVVGANGSTGLAQPILSVIPQVRAVAGASAKGTVAYATTTVRGTTTRENDAVAH